MENSETTTQTDAGAGASASQDGSADQARIDAAESVEAILGDLRHVVGRMPHEDWPQMAATVLEHHDPPIAVDLLGPDHVGLQDACRGALGALSENDYASAKTSIELIRKFEVRLGLELEDIRSEDPA